MVFCLKEDCVKESEILHKNLCKKCNVVRSKSEGSER